MTLQTLIKIGLITAVAAILIIVAIAVIDNMMDRRKPNFGRPIWVIASFLLCVLAGTAGGILSLYTLCIKADAYSHGMVDSNITLQQAKTRIENSPEEDIPPANKKGVIFIYYKFGCEDCEAVYHELKQAFEKANVNVYWVSTQTENGKKLLDSYPVEEVPTGIYVRKQNYNDALSYTQKKLFYKQGNEYHIDEEAIARLVLLQKEGR